MLPSGQTGDRIQFFFKYFIYLFIFSYFNHVNHILIRLVLALKRKLLCAVVS